MLNNLDIHDVVWDNRILRIGPIALAIALIAVFATPIGLYAADPAPVQEYFVPMPESDIYASFDAINGGAVPNCPDCANTLTYISIAVAGNGTYVYYDHWEDGYDNSVTDPTQRQGTTEVWGDGDASTGVPPDGKNLGLPDALERGSVIILSNEVSSNPNNTPSTPYKYDGRDRILVSFPVAISRAAYAVDPAPGPLLAGATELLDSDSWGTAFEAPVGNDIPTSGVDDGDGGTEDTTNPFQYAVFYVMASEDDTSVSLNGAVVDADLDAGENLVIAVDVGDELTSTKPVQVHLVAGDVGSDYEMRWYSIPPTSEWGNDYYTPVSETDPTPGSGSPNGNNESDDTAVWLYNPNDAELTVNYEFESTSGSLTVTGNGYVLYRDVPKNSGGRFYSTSNFFAIAQTDPGGGTGGGQRYDWGHPLLPATQASSQVLVGLGLGSAGSGYAPCNVESNHPSTFSRTIVWVTPLADANINIDYDNDGTVDETISAGKLESVKINDDSVADGGSGNGEGDGDMTGALITGTDTDGEPVDIVVAYGQDPGRSYSLDDCAFDFGTLVPPLPEYEANKNAQLDDQDGDNLFGPGDIIIYSIVLSNQTGQTLVSGTISVEDTIPTNTTYVGGSTSYEVNNGGEVGISDSPGFPLVPPGWTTTVDLPALGTLTVRFKVEIDAYSDVFTCDTDIVNTALIESGVGSTQVDATTDLVCKDWGDLPDTGQGVGPVNYETLSASGGPSHRIVDELGIGSIIDSDNNGQPTTPADGDDTDGNDDEEGIDVPGVVVGDTAVNLSVRAFNTNASFDATLACWIDFDMDGEFDGAGETASTQTVSSGGTNSPTTYVFAFSGFGSLSDTDNLYVRCRVAFNDDWVAVGGVSPNGFVDSGEVEDTVTTVTDPGLAVTIGYFLAQQEGGTITFTWQTATETGSAGFNLLAEMDGDLTQLNDDLIQSKVIDSVSPTDYAFQANSTASVFYVEEVSINGRTNRAGPFVLGAPSGAHAGNDVESSPMIWLPMVSN